MNKIVKCFGTQLANNNAQLYNAYHIVYHTKTCIKSFCKDSKGYPRVYGFFPAKGESEEKKRTIKFCIVQLCIDVNQRFG